MTAPNTLLERARGRQSADGPREGLANDHGVPHRYRCEWDNAADDWSETLEHAPVDAESFELEIEQ